MGVKLKNIWVMFLIVGMIGIGLSGCGNNNSAKGTAQGTRNNRAFVDANNDGVCDNAGMRMGKGKGAGNSGGFYDANNDGICDRTGRKIVTKRN